MIKKLNYLFLGLVVIILLGISIAFFWQQIILVKPYYAVYLSTGEVYFGEINYFPKFNLTNAYLLQRNEQSTQTPYSVAKFSEAFWGPEDQVFINPKNIIWKVKLKEGSQVLNFIKNPQSQQTSSYQDEIQNFPSELQSTTTATSSEINNSATSTH